MTPQEITDYKRKWMPGIMVAVHSDLRTSAKDWMKKYAKQRYHFKEFTAPYEDTWCFESEKMVTEFLKAFEGKKKLRWRKMVQMPLPLDMWDHYCPVEKTEMAIQQGEECNWCGAKHVYE